MKTIKEAAPLMGYSPDYIRVKIHRGLIPAQKRGRDWFLTDYVIEKYKRNGGENGN